MIDLFNLIATTEEGGIPTDTIEVASQETEVVETNQETTETTPEEQAIIDKYNIDGEEVTVDEIREWKKGNLRQADYTKKTTELARQRSESKDAIEMYEYLKSRPEVLKKLAEFDEEGQSKEKVVDKLDPIANEVKQLKYQMKMNDINSQLQSITSKDSTVSDVELLQVANDYGVEIEKAYNIWRGLNIDRILASEKQKTKQEVAESIQKNNTITKTLITTTDTKNEGGNHGLTDAQMLMCQKLDMTPEDYNKYMSNPK